MKAAFVKQPGPADTIIYGDLPDPRPAAGEVLVRVKAVAVNPIDTYVRGGMVKADLPSPFIIGCDLAGVVEQCGPGAARFKPGDRVWASNQGMAGRQGSFAELAAVNEQWLYPTPAGVDDRLAAAGALVGITAHLGLFGRAKLQAGEILFVNGGTGGVGSTVVQMAKAVGARVITTAGSDEKVAACRALGADLALNYNTADIDAEVRKFAPQGVNVWWETLREVNFDRTVALLAIRGRMIVMAGRDARPIFPVGPFYVRDCALHGFAMFNASAAEHRACADDINLWMSEGKLKPRIGREFKLSEAAAAHKLQEENTLHKSGTLAGKIVLVP